MGNPKSNNDDDGNYVPIGFFPKEAGDPTPFTLDWTDRDAAVKTFTDSTNVYRDTCFDNMLISGHIAPAVESVSSTGSSLGGETADTSIEF